MRNVRRVSREEKLTEGFVDRQVSFNDEHGCTSNLIFFEDVTSTTIEDTVDTTDSDFGALEESNETCRSKDLKRFSSKENLRLDRKVFDTSLFWHLRLHWNVIEVSDHSVGLRMPEEEREEEERDRNKRTYLNFAEVNWFVETWFSCQHRSVENTTSSWNNLTTTTMDRISV